MNKLTPNVMVKDVKETVSFYKDNLGFGLVMAVPESQDGVVTEITNGQRVVYALMKHGEVEIMFQSEDSLKEDISVFKNTGIGASISLYIEIDKLEEYYNRIKGNVPVVKDLMTTWYGMNEFYIRDNNGYILGFAEKADPSTS